MKLHSVGIQNLFPPIPLIIFFIIISYHYRKRKQFHPALKRNFRRLLHFIIFLWHALLKNRNGGNGGAVPQPPVPLLSVSPLRRGAKKIQSVIKETIHAGETKYSLITQMPVKGGGHVWVQHHGVITKNEFDGFPIAYSVMINVDDFVQIEKTQSII